MMWLRDAEPETFRAAAMLPPVAGYLLGWLTGVVVQDHANASSSLLYDVRGREWSDRLLAAADIDPRLLAPIRPAHTAACSPPRQPSSSGSRLPAWPWSAPATTTARL